MGLEEANLAHQVRSHKVSSSQDTFAALRGYVHHLMNKLSRALLRALCKTSSAILQRESLSTAAQPGKQQKPKYSRNRISGVSLSRETVLGAVVWGALNKCAWNLWRNYLPVVQTVVLVDRADDTRFTELHLVFQGG